MWSCFTMEQQLSADSLWSSLQTADTEGLLLLEEVEEEEEDVVFWDIRIVLGSLDVIDRIEEQDMEDFFISLDTSSHQDSSCWDIRIFLGALDVIESIEDGHREKGQEEWQEKEEDEEEDEKDKDSGSEGWRTPPESFVN